MRISRRTIKITPVPSSVELEPPKPSVNKGFTRHPDDGAPKVDYREVIDRYTSKITNRKTAIRAFCVTCCSGQLSEVKHCTVKKCPLWGFRLGEDPFNLKVQKRNGLVPREDEE